MMDICTAKITHRMVLNNLFLPLGIFVIIVFCVNYNSIIIINRGTVFTSSLFPVYGSDSIRLRAQNRNRPSKIYY
jgi:hypothetical protein